MEIDVLELIVIVAGHHGIKLDKNENVIQQLKDSPTESWPDEFIDSWNSIIAPLLTSSMEGKDIDRDEIQKLIPEKFYSEIHPIVDGSKMLSLIELEDSLKNDDPLTRPHNSNLVVDKLREQLKSAYAHDDYPILSSLEGSWEILSDHYEVIDREKHPSKSPVESFEYYIEMGFYPPPEIMLFIKEAIELYYHSKGKLSLDEAFFGEAHRKKGSPSFRKGKYFKYSSIEFSAGFIQKKEDVSFESAMEKALEEKGMLGKIYLGIDPDTDFASFMRGYRRWKAEQREP